MMAKKKVSKKATKVRGCSNPSEKPQDFIFHGQINLAANTDKSCSNHSNKLTNLLLNYIDERNCPPVSEILPEEIQKEFDKYDVKDPKSPREYKRACAVYVAKETALIAISLKRVIDSKTGQMFMVTEGIKSKCENVVKYLLDCELPEYSKKLEEEYETAKIAATGKESLKAAETFLKTMRWVHSAVMVEMLTMGKTASKRKPGQGSKSEHSILKIKELLKDEKNFNNMPRGTKKESWEWIAQEIKYIRDPQATTPLDRAIRTFLKSKLTKTQYKRLKILMEKK